MPRGTLPLPLSGSIRARIVALGFLAAIPSVGMASIIAGQDYRSREHAAIARVEQLQSTAVERIDVAVASLGASLSSIAAHMPDLASACPAEFSRVARAAAIASFDSAGLLLCQRGVITAQDAAADPSGWFRQVQGGAAPALALAGGHAVVAVPTPARGVLAAAFPAGWFSAIAPADLGSAQVAFWLFDAQGGIIAAAGPTAEALPAVGTLVALRSRPGAVLARSATGLRYAYAASTLPSGWQVLSAYPATREHVKALRVLYTRLLDLAGLLLLGLATTVLGADIAFGDPLRRLRGALAAWQRGGAFDRRGLAHAPTELAELAESFAQATVSLREQQAELERFRARQELLMLEIHHRVKNNLQIVASLLNLQASRIRVPEARAEFQSARDRVRALATLHRHLYYEGEINAINMASFLAELCGQLFQAMGETPGGRIQLAIEAEPLRLSTDQAVPLALIVTEAVTNAIKYGFPAGRPGAVSIRLAQHGGSIDLEVADDGVGIPPGRGETEGGPRDGIGLQLIRGFAKQLGATLDIRHGPGTRYSVHMPLHREPKPGEPKPGEPKPGEPKPGETAPAA